MFNKKLFKGKKLQISLVMLAAGESTRFNLAVKKQFLRLGSEPLWLYASKNLSSFYPFKKIVVTSSNTSYYQKFAPFYEIVQGGKTRAQSLLNALEKINSEWVMVSDVARVCISKSLFTHLIENMQNADCITPALKVADTTLYNNEPLQREHLKLIQTPQLSKTKLLKEALQNALEKGVEFTDDSTAVASVGGKIWYIAGDEKAKKITYKEDLKALNLPPPSTEFFCGSGFDVHEFGEKRALLLGGVEVHQSMGVKAHSDGDLIAHALSDAILGAASLGDIGEYFPDTKAEFKNANSMILLQKCYELAMNYGFELVNADVTLIAQAPKISPFKSEIAKNIAKSLGVDEFRINVKATTTEKLGFIGRKEGIAALASVNLKYYDWTKI